VGRNVLVVSTVDHAEDRLRKRLGGEIDELKVVVPVVRQGLLDWLAMDERAFSHADEEAHRLAEQLPGETVEAGPGEADVRLAIQDALAVFPADEVVVAVHPDDESGFVERAATEKLGRKVDGVPVSVVVISEEPDGED
jgi:hypothetical protein